MGSWAKPCSRLILFMNNVQKYGLSVFFTESSYLPVSVLLFCTPKVLAPKEIRVYTYHKLNIV